LSSPTAFHHPQADQIPVVEGGEITERGNGESWYAQGGRSRRRHEWHGVLTNLSRSGEKACRRRSRGRLPPADGTPSALDR
jgi:hypothetical protein